MLLLNPSPETMASLQRFAAEEGEAVETMAAKLLEKAILARKRVRNRIIGPDEAERAHREPTAFDEGELALLRSLMREHAGNLRKLAL